MWYTIPLSVLGPQARTGFDGKGGPGENDTLNEILCETQIGGWFKWV